MLKDRIFITDGERIVLLVNPQLGFDDQWFDFYWKTMSGWEDLEFIYVAMGNNMSAFIEPHMRYAIYTLDAMRHCMNKDTVHESPNADLIAARINSVLSRELNAKGAEVFQFMFDADGLKFDIVEVPQDVADALVRVEVIGEKFAEIPGEANINDSFSRLGEQNE